MKKVAPHSRTPDRAPVDGPGVPGAPAFGAMGWQPVEAG
jgi:hypothetical protein